MAAGLPNPVIGDTSTPGPRQPITDPEHIASRDAERRRCLAIIHQFGEQVKRGRFEGNVLDALREVYRRVGQA